MYMYACVKGYNYTCFYKPPDSNYYGVVDSESISSHLLLVHFFIHNRHHLFVICEEWYKGMIMCFSPSRKASLMEDGDGKCSAFNRPAINKQGS